MNVAEYTYSLDETSSVKVIFSDGTIKQYNNEASFEAFATGEAATQYFTIQPDDPLFTKPVKSIRFAHSKGLIDLDVTYTSLIKDMIALVNKEVVGLISNSLPR